MDYSKIRTLDAKEKCLLALYTLFTVKDMTDNKLRKLMADLTGFRSLDVTVLTKRLVSLGFLNMTSYNWRNNSYDYAIKECWMLPCMLYLFEEEKPMIKDFLEKAKILKPAPIQKVFWHYICNNFSVVDEEALDMCVYSLGNDYFLPVMLDERFANLVLKQPTYVFYDLIENLLVDIFDNMKMVDVNYIRSLIASYKVGEDKELSLRMQCLTDLYDYMAYGRLPKKLLATNKNHCIIAGIVEMYKGNNAEAFKHFKTALMLHNKQGYASKRVAYLPLATVNFFYVLACYLEGTETGRKAALGINRAQSVFNTDAAKTLYCILYNSATDKQLKAQLKQMRESQNIVDRILGFFMSMYMGLKSQAKDKVNWAILKQEMRKYLTLDEATLAALNASYGEKQLLTSVYHKQEWESVLEQLMQGSGVNKSAEERKEERIAYVLYDIEDYNVEVRLQKRLKSGAWGAGKVVPLSNFYNIGYVEMTDSDKRIAQSAKLQNLDYYRMDLKNVLPEMVEDQRLLVGHYAPFSPVTVTEVPPYITLTRTPNGFDVSSNVPVESANNSVVVVRRDSCSIDFVQLSALQQSFYTRLLTLGHFPLEAEEQLRDFLSNIGGKIDVNSDLIEGGSTMPIVEGTSQLTVQIKPAERGIYELRVMVRPLENGRVQCKPYSGDEVIVDCDEEKNYMRVQRNMEKERENAKAFVSAANLTLRSIGSTITLEAYELLPVIEYAQQHTDQISCEWKDGAHIKISNRSSASWNGAIRKNENGWFEIEGSVELEQNKVISMAELLDLVSQSPGRYIKLSDGEFIAISDKLQKQLAQLNAIAARSHGRLQMSPFSAALLGPEVLKGELTLEQDRELKKIRQRIKNASNYTPDVPKTLNATLRNYQKEGFCWMSRLNKWGAGALLADDMGLGKTIQTITFMLSKSEEGPALVVAPASVAPNWKTEFEKFAPSLNVSLLNFADNRDALVKNAKAGDVVITTYGLLLSVKEALTEKHWTTICLDEAHIIKNRGAKTSAVAMQLKSDNRVMLTGTPVQNHLSELWNLFQFVNPGLLGNFEDFSRRFIIPIEQNGDKVMQKELDRLVKPFMLRRTKDKVAKELPSKEEIYQHVTLSEEEMLVYEVLRRKAEALLLSEGGGKVSMNTLSEITRLRQCSCDCRLVEEGRKGAGDKPGSKITALLELLETIIDGLTVKKNGTMNGGVLVFSQFTSYLALIKKALDTEGIKYLYIDGSVPIKTRQELVEEFQKGACPVFLISLKAGGLGLNLTRANYVIHTDPWWNPAIEAQATDRAHRIGQKQAVTVYHLIAEGTIEEKIQRLHERKQALVQEILESTDMSHKLTGEDLLEMVRGK